MTFTSLAVSWTHKCGISGGSVYCWGSNTKGQLGLGTTDTVTHTAPAKISGALNFSAVAVGNESSCALGVDSQLYCWGKGVAVPTVLPGSRAYASFSLLAKVDRVCALTAAGVADCWTSFTSQPRTIQSGVEFRSVSVGGWGLTSTPFACGLTATGEVWCWTTTSGAMKLGTF